VGFLSAAGLLGDLFVGSIRSGGGLAPKKFTDRWVYVEGLTGRKYLVPQGLLRNLP
jgi:hypothetical protein